MKGAPKGNQFAKGNSGGGRPSVKETIWHKEKWEMDSKVRELEAKIATGIYSVRDVYLLKALKADPVILKNLADKVLANLMDVTSGGKKLGIPILNGVIPSNDSDKEGSKPE